MGHFFANLFWLLFWVAVVLVAAGLWSYNGLQRFAQLIKEQSSNVQIAISKKLSLINQLIDVVRNFQEAEQFTHLKISQDASTGGLMSAYQQSGMLLTSLQGMAQRFPELRASEQYHRLVTSIQECEADIQQQREHYNARVREYNTKCLSIPTVFVARAMGFSSAPYLEFDLGGARDVTTLKDFKTDDGERLQQLLGGAGARLASASRSIVNQAADAGRPIADSVKDRVEQHGEASYFFVLPGGVPEGPSTLAAIRASIAARSADATAVKIARQGSSDWQPLPPA